MILTLHPCTVSVACGHHTSSSRDTDTALRSLSLLLVNPSSLSCWEQWAGTNTEHGGVGWGQTGAQTQTAAQGPDAPADTGCCPITSHFYFCITWNFSAKARRREAAVQGSLCWPLLLRPTTVCSSAQMSIPFGNSGFIKSSRQHAIIYPALTWCSVANVL